MKYQIIKVKGILSEPEFENVVIEREDGSFESFPVDENNSRYQQFLISLENDSVKPGAKK